MSKLTNDIEKLAEIGKELVRYGRLAYGLTWVTLEDGIKVYSADNSDHTAFDIDGFQIGYFTPIKVEVGLDHLSKLPEYIKRAEALLDKLKVEAENGDGEKAELEKKKKIDRMKEAIAELEAIGEKK